MLISVLYLITYFDGCTFKHEKFGETCCGSNDLFWCVYSSAYNNGIHTVLQFSTLSKNDERTIFAVCVKMKRDQVIYIERMVRLFVRRQKLKQVVTAALIKTVTAFVVL